MEVQRQQMLMMLDYILGNSPKLDVSIAVGTMEDGSDGYQVMTSLDDFFDWYCYHYPNGQFHKTPMLAVQNFLKYRLIWIEAGSPQPF